MVEDDNVEVGQHHDPGAKEGQVRQQQGGQGGTHHQLEDRREADQRDEDHGGRDHGAQPALRAALVVHGAAAEAPRDGVAAEQPRGQVGHAQPHQLHAAVQLVVVDLGELLGDGDALHEPHDDDGQDHDGELAQVDGEEGAAGELREAGGDVVDDGDAAPLQVDGGLQDDADDRDDERAGGARPLEARVPHGDLLEAHEE